MATLFLAEKEFSGARGLVVSDEMAVAIAAQACLPALALGLDWLDGFVGIVVHEDAVVARREVEDDDGVVHAYDEELSGEAMSGGPVMLAWRDVDEAGESAADGYNVVVHEFAHVIDMRGGVTAGVDDGRSRERARPLAARAGRRVRALRRPGRRATRRPSSIPTAPRRSRSSSRSRPRRSSSRRASSRPNSRASTSCCRSSSARTRRPGTPGKEGPPARAPLRRGEAATPSPARPSACRSSSPAGCRAAACPRHRRRR